MLTFTLPEYRMHQEEMIHFRYLTTVEGGLLHTAPDLDAHFEQLGGGAGARRRPRRAQPAASSAAFIRPAGLDVPATPVFADALERAGARRRPPRSVAGAGRLAAAAGA